MAADIKLRWRLDVVDSGGPAKLLKTDRELRRGITQTDAAYKRMASTAVGAGNRMTQSSSRVARAHGLEGRALRGLSSEARGAARSIDGTVAANRRAASSSDRVASSYRQQIRAAKELSRVERTRASAQKAGGAAIAAGAAGGRLLTTGTAAGAAAAAAAGAGAIKIFAGFEKQMDAVAAVSDASRRQLGLLEDQAKSLGASTNFSNREVAAGMYELATAGFKVSEILKAIPGTLDLAAASGTDLARAAEIQAAQLRAFELPASKATHVADVLATAVNRSAINMDDLGESMAYVAPVAGRFNQTFEDMSAAVAILGNVGIKGSMAGTAIRRGLVSVIKPSGKTIDVLDQAGISAAKFSKITTDSQGKLRPFPQILGGLATALKGVDGATRRRTLAQLFGTEALPGMITLVDKGQGSIERMSGALRDSDGAARKTARTMRDNVAGAFDQFTGSVETAATTIVERFGPSIKKGLLAAAGGVTAATGKVADFIKGVGGGTAPPPQVSRGAARTEGLGRARPQTPATSGAENLGARVRKIGGDIGSAVKSFLPVVIDAGRQLVDAFRPALPFFQNVLLPLLKGIGKGLLISVVGAFKIAVPIIKVFATALGAIGTVLRPLRPVFEKLGIVIGVVFSGPITKALGGLGKIGAVFRVLNAPIKLVTGAFGLLGRGIFGALKWMTKLNPALIAVRLVMNNVPRVIASTIGRAASAAKSVAGGILKGFDFIKTLPSRIAGYARKVPLSIAHAVEEGMSGLLGFFGRIGKRLMHGLARGITAAIGAVATAFAALKPSFDIDLNPIGGVHFHMKIGGRKLFRKGGRAYADGGLVPSYVSSGEQIVEPGGSSWMVPGTPVAADNVFAMLTPGSAVLTGDGQARMAAGMSLGRALATQAPHFARGGVVGASMFGGPGDPTTKKPDRGYKGDYLEHAPMTFAELGNGHALGGLPYRTPITVSYHGRSLVVRKRDIGKGGGNVDGKKRAIDLYYRAAAKLGFHGLGVVRWQTGSRPGASSSPGDRTLPITLGRSATRAGLIEDAFSTALGNARAGTNQPRAEFLSGIRSALRQTQTTRTISGGSRSSSRSSGGGYSTAGSGTTRMDGKPVASWIARILRRARADGTSFRVSSGFRSRAEQTRLWNQLGQDPRIVARPGTSNHEGAKYPRGAVDLSPGWQNMVAWLRKHPNAPLRHYSEPRDPYHFSASGHRRGGIVRRYATGGRVGPTLTKALGSVASSAGGSLDRFAKVVDEALSSRLEALRKQLLAQIRRGGDAKVVARLQAALSIIDRALGARIGKTLRLVDQTKARVEAAGTAVDRLLRIYGVDSSSSAGLTAIGMYVTTVAIPAAQKNVARIQRAIDAAKRAGQTQTVRDLEEELKTAVDDLAELFTSQVERFRDIVRAAAQERVDATQFWVDFQQNNLAGLDVAARLNGTVDTPAAMVVKAQAIQSQLIPALQQSVVELRQQNLDLLAVGDMNGARAAFLAMQQAGLDLASAMADAADLLKQAAEQAAQDVVDSAGHSKNLADLGLARLELEQRLAGTYDTGSAARAAYINDTIIPALNRELDALRSQSAVAMQQGDQKLADQIAEAIAQKQNDILQAQLDTQEQIAENTAPKPVGGTLGFAYGGENLNDVLVTVGNGS